MTAATRYEVIRVWVRSVKLKSFMEVYWKFFDVFPTVYLTGVVCLIEYSILRTETLCVGISQLTYFNFNFMKSTHILIDFFILLIAGKFHLPVGIITYTL